LLGFKIRVASSAARNANDRMPRRIGRGFLNHLAIHFENGSQLGCVFMGLFGNLFLFLRSVGFASFYQTAKGSDQG
jgi:hypothetical protein